MYRNKFCRRFEWCKIHTRRKDWWRIRSRISHVFPIMREAERTGFSDQIPNIYTQGLVFLESFFFGSHKRQALWCLCGPSWPCWLGQAWMIPTSRSLWRVGEVLPRIFFPDWGEERGPQLTAGGGGSPRFSSHREICGQYSVV